MPYPLGGVWAVGDSKTYGIDGNDGGGCAWRDPSWSFLSAVGGNLYGSQAGGENFVNCPISGLPLKSDGHNGFTLAQITAGMSGWYSFVTGNQGVPSGVVFYGGTNDCVQFVSGTPGFSYDQMFADFDTSMATLFGLIPSTIPVFVCQLDPMVAFAVYGSGNPLPPFNAYVAAAVKRLQRQGKRAYLVSLDSVSSWDAGGVHQDTAGYAQTGAAIVHAIKTLAPG